ncbi:MAG: ABC transporter substrate-binding protein [Candidatus Latescibacterota bacterium]|nr:ABC transporter substrate-binding protein [Candidatus Latescibacterota bacterium]
MRKARCWCWVALLCGASTTWAAAACIESYDPAVDYFPHKTSLQYAESFAVEYFNNYKVITVLAPWPGAAESVQYVLVQCGTPAPAGYAGAQRIEVPVRRLAIMSTTQLPHLELLDAVDRLVAVSDIKMVHSAAVNRRFKDGAIAEIGHGAGVNLELVLDLETDLVMAVAAAQSQYNAHPVLQQAGAAVAINAEYTEPSLLGRSEWLKFTAAFFNAEGVAEKHFAHIASQYQQYAALMRDLPAADRPTVYGGSLWRGTWHVAGGQSYAAQLIAAAGGAYLWADSDSRQSLPLDFEAVYEKAHDADFWLTMRNEWHARAEVAAADERYADFAAFKSGRVFNANARLSAHGGNDYWESGIVEPHLVLADYIKILHPERLPEHALKYYKQLD